MAECHLQESEALSQASGSAHVSSSLVSVQNFGGTVFFTQHLLVIDMAVYSPHLTVQYLELQANANSYQVEV